MKLKPYLEGRFIDECGAFESMAEMLVSHFNYSIKDIKSYDELTTEEKSIIPKDLFNKITE